VTIDALRWIPKTRSLLVSGEKNSIIKVEELLRQFDVPSSANMEDTGEDNFTQATNFLVFKLQYQKGDEIQNAIKKIGTSLTSVGEASKQPLTEAINSLQWIEATNSLLASGDSESLQKIKHLIEDLDIPLNQVLIEVLVLETSLLNGQSFGLEWAARGQYKNRLTSSLSNVTSGTDAFSTGFNAVNPQVGPISSNLPLLSGFDLGVIGNTLFHKGQSFLTLASLINALQTDSDSTIIMNPKIVTQDNKSATVFVGQNIPFVGSVITSTTATQTSTTSLEYRNIGTTLTVTPVIGENDLISLEIVTEISSTVGTPQATETGQVNGIITNETTMNTRVHVPNQHFLILSGMLNDQETHSKTGIPCLGGLPIVGAAFSNNSRTATKNNVLIFVRPHIIKSYDDYKKVTEHQENLYKDQYPSKNMKESIDRGIDMLKTYIDE
jgi:type III secretion protein C